MGSNKLNWTKLSWQKSADPKHNLFLYASAEVIDSVAYDRESEAPGGDSIIQSAISGHVSGSQRCGSPFGKSFSPHAIVSSLLQT